MFDLFALLYCLCVGNLKNLSMHARKYTSHPWPSIIGPPKSICISSFGSTHGFSVDHLVFGIMLLRFLPNSVHGRHVFDLLMRSLFMNGHHSLVANSVIPHAPGCVACSTSITASSLHWGLIADCPGGCTRRSHLVVSSVCGFVCLRPCISVRPLVLYSLLFRVELSLCLS